MANFCVNGPAYTTAEAIRFGAFATAANIRQGVALVQFALSAAEAIENFRKLRNVSSRAIAVEEEQQGHLRDTYWPAETQMLEEYTRPTPWESQSTLRKRYAGRLWAPYAAQFAKEMHKLQCEKPRYCTQAFTKRMQELLVQRAAAHATSVLVADKIAFYEIAAVSETDFSRRQKVIALRQGLVGQAASLMQAAANGYAGVAQNALNATNNAMQAFGAARADRNNANAGVGRDPFFHQQVARGAMASQASAADASFEADWAAMTNMSGGAVGGEGP